MRSTGIIRPKPDSWLVQRYRRRTLRRAVARAYAKFVNEYPTWQGNLFDVHFICNGAARLLDSYAQLRTVDPEALAEAWADQWSWNVPTRARLLAEVRPVSAIFLGYLEAELSRV